MKQHSLGRSIMFSIMPLSGYVCPGRRPIMKLLACAGLRTAGVEEISAHGGLYVGPFHGGCSALSGFASKWYLGIGALRKGSHVSGGALQQRPECPILSARRSCCVFRSDENIEQHMELPLGAKVSMVALAAACLLLGLFSHAAVGYIQPAVHRLFLGGGA